MIFFSFSAASHVSQFPSLNFLVYVPKSSESPLYIQSSDSVGGVSLTDNFLVPQWGGMVIYNPAEPSGEGGGSGRGGVSMEELMPVFIEQLKMLLGVPDLAMVSGTVCVYCSLQVGWKSAS